MTGKVSVGKGDFPYRGKSLIQFVFEHQLQYDQKTVLLNKKTQGQLFELIRLHDFQGKEKQTLVMGPTTLYQRLFSRGGSKTDFTQAKLRNLLTEALRLIAKEKISEVNLLFLRNSVRIFGPWKKFESSYESCQLPLH
jgi:leucyl aminopeptidase